MRALQMILGITVALLLLWGYISFYQGRELYSEPPPVLEDIPWSNNPAKPAHVATILFIKPCGEPQIAKNEDLIACFERMGLETGMGGAGMNWATFQSGTGLMPSVHRIEWTSKAGELPIQLDTYKES